jgi:Polysaccharide pyruvyl transferase
MSRRPTTILDGDREMSSRSSGVIFSGVDLAGWRAMARRALLVGWFSLAEMGATAGDLAACRTVSGWLDDAGWTYDVALGSPFEGGVDWRTVRQSDYSHVVHVCGPVGEQLAVTGILRRFPNARLIAVDVSVVGGDGADTPFDTLIARDGDGAPRPDLAFAAPTREVPLVGVIRAHPQLEYGDGHHEQVDAAIDALMQRSQAAFVPIDTRLDVNSNGLRTPDEVSALIARMDAVVTSRLHGLVLALRNGVPALAIDPIPGGAKVSAQAAATGWEHVLMATELSPERLDAMLERCLTRAAREAAAGCAAGVGPALDEVRAELLQALGAAPRLPGVQVARGRFAALLRRGAAYVRR